MPFALTIGFFDGVHAGHRHLLHRTLREAELAGLKTIAMTFDRHPLTIVRPEKAPHLLTTVAERTALLKAAGIDRVEVLEFNRETARLTSEEFINNVLAPMDVKLLVLGHDNSFGSDRTATFDDYQRYCAAAGITLHRADAFLLDGSPVSSSRVRHLVKDGDMRGATTCLCRHYDVEGIVVHGKKNGRQIGFPTANIQFAADKLLPKPGVYATKAYLKNESGEVAEMLSMTNIGTRPTFNGTELTVETNLFDFDRDIYGETLHVEFIERLRDEQPFSSIPALVDQLTADRSAAINLLK